ncbi:hypothetical protein [Streptomyces sp. NPDC048172]|uniref:hypothetical protein n=1 Tax=Streptomyces sp. NPDC048172 TaxID=3365505 RepID=UPI0037196924
MLVLLLSVVLLLVIGGCVCVVWTARGDAPRWARGVARVTRLGSDVTRSVTPRNSRSQQNSSSSADE